MTHAVVLLLFSVYLASPFGLRYLIMELLKRKVSFEKPLLLPSSIF